MKKYLYYLLAFCLVSSFFSSCTKDNQTLKEGNDLTTEKSDIQFSKSLDEFDYEVKVNNGMMVFETFDAFKEVMAKMSSTDQGYYTPEAIANWQKSLGFESMGLEYQTALEAFEAVDSDAALQDFLAQYPTVELSDDPETDEIILPVAHIYLAYLLNKEGKVMIEGNLHQFTKEHQFIVIGESHSKLQTAVESMEQDKDNGIFILKYVMDDEHNSLQESLVEDRNGACGTSYDGQQQSGSKKVVSEIRLIATASPVQLFPGVFVWDHFVDARFKGKSEKKNWRGKWRSYKTWVHYYSYYEVCSTVNNATQNDLRQDYHWPSYTTSEYTYLQRLRSGRTTPPPNVSASFNFWEHVVYNYHDEIRLDRGCH